MSNYIFNTSWLILSKVYRMGFALLVTVAMARYLGPEKFGIFNYAFSLVTLFSVFITLGLENIVVREVLNNKQKQEQVLSSSILLRLIGSIFFIIFSLSAVYFLRPSENETQFLVLVLSIGYVFKSIEILRYWFESQVKAKYSATLEVVAFTVSIGLKIAFIILNLPLIYFAFAVAAESVVMAFGLIFVFSKQSDVKLIRMKASFLQAKYLMGEAWPLILASALYIVFTKIDQIMLGELVGSESVGIYAAAVKISEGWYFVPGMIATSLYPLMLKAKKRSRKSYIDITQQLLNVMVLIAVLAAVFIGIISSNLINLTFGQYYSESANILIAHIWGGVFIAIGGVSYRYLIAEGLQKYSFYRALFGAIVNICLNLFLIPRYGATGAAVATVLSQFMTLYLFNSLNKATRELFYMQSKALSLTGTPSTIRFLKGLRNS